MKCLDMNMFWEINSSFPGQGRFSSTAQEVEKLLPITSGRALRVHKEDEEPKESEAERKLAPISRRHLIRPGWACEGLAPVSPFLSHSYIRSIWKNNFAWQNTVYGKLTHFSRWCRCHKYYDVKALVLEVCRLLTEITRNMLLQDLTFIHSVHQVLICT